MRNNTRKKIDKNFTTKQQFNIIYKKHDVNNLIFKLTISTTKLLYSSK